MLSQEVPMTPTQGRMGPLLNKLSILSQEKLGLNPLEAKIHHMKTDIQTAMRWFEADRASAYGRIKQSYTAFQTAEKIINTPFSPAVTKSPEEAESARRAKERLSEEQQHNYEAARDAYQVQLTSFLFARNKEQFREAKGSLDAYDSRKEDKQIEGVVRALHGQHLHMGTGEGKSTVVLPITSLVDAATNGDGRVVVGSANSLLVDELKANTEKMAGVMGELPFYADTLQLSLSSENKENKAEFEKNQENILRSMNRDILTKGEISKKTKEKIKTHHWESHVKNFEDSENMEEEGWDTYLEKGDGTIKIFFAEEKQLVFDWMNHKELFEAQCPSIYMDEAHVAYDKKTPYSISNPSLAVSNRDVREGVVDWVARYLVAQKITPADVIPNGGQDEIRSELLNAKIRAMDFNKITLNGTDAESTQFRGAVDIIINSLGESPKERTYLQKRILKDLQTMTPAMGENDIPYGLQKTEKELKELDMQIKRAKLDVMLTGRESEEIQKKYKTALQQLLDEKNMALEANQHSATPESDSPHQSYMESIAADLARFINLKGKEFVDNKQGVVIRDSYVDELMEEHKYEPTMQATVLAMAGKFEPIKRQVAFKTVTYPSFLHAMKDNIVALSGTLMYPDSQKAQMKKGSFATFLESETGREVKMLAVPEIKPFPQPELYKTMSDVYVKLIKDLKWEQFIDTEVRKESRPTLIIDFNGVGSAVRTFEEMKKLYGEERVRFLSSKPTGGIEAINYHNNLETYRKQLANGEIDILVSTGSAALGVNFEKSDGTFPDLRTVSLGLPDSEERIAQTIGRRRMREGSTRNHLWYLSMDSLEKSISLLQSDTNIYKFDLKKTREEMHEALEKALASQDQKKSAKLVLDLMDETRGSRATATDFQEGYDDFMNERVTPYAEKYMKERIARELLRYDETTVNSLLDAEFMSGKKEEKPSRELLIRNSMLNTYFQSLGLPSTLHNDILSEELLAQLKGTEAFPTHFVHEQIELRLKKIQNYVLHDTKEGFQLDEKLNRWFEEAKQATIDYARAVDLEGIIPTLVMPFGIKKHYVRAAVVDADLEKILREILAGRDARIVGQNSATTIVSIPSDERYSIPLIIDRATGQRMVLTTLGNGIFDVNMGPESEFGFDNIPLTLGLPNMTGGVGQNHLYLMHYRDIEEKK